MRSYVLITLAALALFVAIATAEPSYTITLTNVVNKVVPNRTTKHGGDFILTNSVAQGAYIENSKGKIYMALTSGTNGVTEPTHGSGTATCGSITYYRVQEKNRKGVVVSNVGTNTLWWTMYEAGSGATPGIPLTANGYITFDADLQGDVYVGTNGVISVQEL